MTADQTAVGEDAQCEVDVPYFAHRPIFSLHGLLAHTGTLLAAQDALGKSRRGAFWAGRQVYVLDEIWSQRDQVAGLARQSPGVSSANLRALFGSYRLVPAWTGPRGTVWRVFPLTNPGRSSGTVRRMKGDAERNTSAKRSALAKRNVLAKRPTG